MKRISFGIKKLDESIEGGIPHQNIVLVAGGAGTGKSTICLQFCVEGARKKQKSLYITTEQSREELKKQAACYGWDLEELSKTGYFDIFYLDVLEERSFLTILEKCFVEHAPERIVIDSVTTLTDNLSITDFKDRTAFSMVEVMENVIPTPTSERLITKSVLYGLISKLKRETNATVILTSELYEGSIGLSADGVSEFICDGVIKLDSLKIGAMEKRALLVKKMRYTNHKKKYLLYGFSKNGIEIKEDETKKL